MSKIEYNVFEIEPNGLSGFITLSNEDTSLIASTNITKTFKPNDNFIELSYFTLNDVRLNTVPSYTNYSILSGDRKQDSTGNTEIGIDVQQDYIAYGYDGTEVKALYNFLDYTYSDNLNPQDFYIESISPDRTEVRVVSVNLEGSNVLETTNQIIPQFTADTYSPDYYMYFGNNIFYSIINVGVEQFRDTTAVILKLYNPLPSTVNLKARVNVVEKVSNSIAFEINTTITQDAPVVPTLRGANFNIEVETQTTEPSQYYNYNELFSFPTTNTYREINSLFSEKGAELGIDYSDFNNFINYSSAEERIRNFKYKLDLINSYQTNLDILTSATYVGEGIVGSKEYYENLIKGVINNLDHYERHLYYSNKPSAWPKSNLEKPYINQSPLTPSATAWYNAELESAILYDAQNVDILTNTVPSYLREDPANKPYELFIHMIAQHFDNLWLYTDSVSKKYDADNRLDRGVSKDLVEELLKNFGVKLYTSNKSAEDLFRYFTVNSYDTQDEYIPDGIIKSNQDQLSQNDYQKEIYKRIYHNLPLLLKSKGTERGMRALINCFGIPSDVLKIKVYGGQSAEDLPFFGGEQAWTSSLDKVRLNNTGSIVEGGTLSFYTSILNNENKFTNDLHRIEVGFSPSDNINNYIVSQSAVLFPNSTFNIDDYIGDPREIKTNKYSALQEYADEIFNNVDRYNLKDFVRLIKFFDNVVFRMIRDFVPARSVTDTGIIIKPHLLERNKHTSPVMTWTRPEYSGSIDTAFITGSNGGAYKSVGFGATGSLFNKESSTRKPYNVQTPIGKRGSKDKLHEQPKYNGELHKSNIKVTNGELNKDNPFKNLEYPNVIYTVQFFIEPPTDVCTLITTPLSPFVIDPNSVNSNFASYNLGNMFLGSSGAYDYEVVTNGELTALTGQNVTYDFLQGGTYQQYQIFETLTYHEDNNSLFGGTCTNTRQAIIVVCDLSLLLNNVPSTVEPLQTYDISTWWNSTTSLNTDITYIIDGINYSPTEIENFTFSETVYTNEEIIDITIQENNNPTGCKLELQVEFNSCTISPIELPFYVNSSDQYTFPYNFAGVLENITTFSFRLEWCETGFFGIDACTVGNTYVSNWIDIDPNNLVESGELENILLQYPAADNINFNESPVPPTYQSFTAIKSYMDANIYTNGPFRIRFKAQNGTGCVEEHPTTAILSSPPPPPSYNNFNIPYNSALIKACCEGPTTQTIYTLAPSTYSLLHENTGALPNPPAIFSSINPLTYAPSGWYTDGEIARHWNGDWGFWGATTSFPPSSTQTQYIDCSNNIHVDLNQCI